ncbi:hypothetical protein, partial [Lutibacter sp.]
LLNPSKEMHVQKITELVDSPFINLNDDPIKIMMNEMMFDSFIRLEIEYENYWFYSVGYYSNRLKTDIHSFGVFGMVFILSN